MNAGEMSEWRFGESCFCSPTSAESAKTRKTKHTSLSYSYIEKNITYTTDLVRVSIWADCVVFTLSAPGGGSENYSLLRPFCY